MSDDGPSEVHTAWEDPDLSPAGDRAEESDSPDISEDEGEGSAHLDDYTHDDYLAATTREYQGLAEDIAAAEGLEYERQAVAASMPGVGSGLVGFEDDAR